MSRVRLSKLKFSFFFSLKKLKSMNLGHCNIENLKISNFVFSLLVGQKPVSGEFTTEGWCTFFGGGVRIDQKDNTEKSGFWIFMTKIIKNHDFSWFSEFWKGKIVFSRNRREGERIGAGNAVASRWCGFLGPFQPVRRLYDKNTSFWVAPTVRISARKPGFPGFDNNHVSESSWRTLDCGVFDVFHSDRFPRLGIVHLPRRY